MKSTELVIDRHQARELKVLGIEQEGALFYWGHEEGETEESDWGLYSDHGELSPTTLEMQGVEDIAAAYTLQELMTLLGNFDDFFVAFYKDKSYWVAQTMDKVTTGSTALDAVYSMVIKYEKP
jgi:hypothetical protein